MEVLDGFRETTPDTAITDSKKLPYIQKKDISSPAM